MTAEAIPCEQSGRKTQISRRYDHCGERVAPTGIPPLQGNLLIRGKPLCRQKANQADDRNERPAESGKRSGNAEKIYFVF